MSDALAADRLHMKYCLDKACRIENPENPGDRCRTMDHLIREAGKDSATPADVVKTSPSDEHLSSFRLTRRLEEEMGDTSNPYAPGVGPVRPEFISILAYPTDGIWYISLVAVVGPKVSKSTGNLTKKHYEVPFIDPLDAQSKAPDWIKGISRFWENRLNGRPTS